MKTLPKIDNSWSLFLDRDGVINKKIEGGYVKSIEEFEIFPNVLKSLAYFSKIFYKIIVVTNQQGIGKQLMSENDLHKIHQHLVKEVESNGGRIDAIYFAPQLASENSLMRKPNLGMACVAKEQFPNIEFQKSIMVGDSHSDMVFADRAQMFGIFIGKSASHFSIDSLNDLRTLLK
ncbi:MAG: HAD-IIIA family hydrolase [Bacteroidota bacterium]|nr:HAD-IIIA family hydrolase [Bacteroidota bacterium]